MRAHNLGPKDIFFTDESIFPLCSYMNRGTNKIRLSKKTKQKLKAGDEEAINFLVAYVMKDLEKSFFIAVTLIVLLTSKY